MLNGMTEDKAVRIELARAARPLVDVTDHACRMQPDRPDRQTLAHANRLAHSLAAAVPDRDLLGGTQRDYDAPTLPHRPPTVSGP
ncbi:hypothetical protein Bcep18194_A4944 [Burkholderia lata]|uniref:Uncharacterized protein n=1 Tax=Burkholderia lata (strain ATCC 17760 / DSM 23089 / LMG 22485 / NCIMB 9086 / R18194 / 383) TaxID=482957 RepID=Q39G78_BURL3|nr:hypothetical protein Bcep18194_A4944 [Burkholderia lata]